jgi:hypothetical protein
MGEVDVLISVRTDSSVKYHSVKTYILICAAKTHSDSIWWAVLVGRYPSGYKSILFGEILYPEPWRLQKTSFFEKNKKGDYSKKLLYAKLVISGKTLL